MYNQTACEELIQRAILEDSHLLDLSHMGLSDIPRSIVDIEYLTELNLNNNSFITLPDIINELKNLQRLYIRNNCFSYHSGLGFSIVNNLDIEYIDLSLNNLSRVPEEIFYLKSLKEVDFSGNPLINGVPSSIIEQGFEAIHSFVEEIYLSETSDKLLEAKLIFVGQGEVGKTSLMKKITEPTKKIIEGYEPTTHGINVRKWYKEVYFTDEELVSLLKEQRYSEYDEDEEFDTYSTDKEINNEDGSNEDVVGINDWEECDIDEYYNPLVDDRNRKKGEAISGTAVESYNFKEAQFNIWDFGGQEIYYSTHQFFLTKRSVYIFVWDARKEEDYDRFLYWFNTINVLSEKSPIIVVMNKSDIREKPIEEAILRSNFPNIINFHKTSCITGVGIKDLNDSIDVAFKKLSHIGDSLPKDWISVRNSLYELKEDFITYEKFIEICKNNNISKQRANFLSSYLHDLGDILHFLNDDILLKIVILNPDWVTHAFYKLIDSKYIQNNNGKFTLDQLIYVWHHVTHPKEKHSELIRLIESFELCFNILGTNEYILPELLPINSTYKDVFVHDYRDTRFQYQFKFMPSGLMTRFICRNFVMIKANSYWKNGVVIQYEDSLALIVIDVIEKKIDISINGDNREGLLGVVRKEFNTIFYSLKLDSEDDYNEMVPCNCDVCIGHEKAHYFKFSVLRKFNRKGIHSTYCPISVDEVSVSSLTKGFERIRPAERVLEHLLITCAQLQGLYKLQGLSREDDRNTYISFSLSNRGLFVKDQTRWGSSASGISRGEIDIKIESETGMAISIFEGFNLSYLDAGKIHYHLEKIFSYDPNGLDSNYIVVYVDSKDFMNLWVKYMEKAMTANYKYDLISGFEDITQSYNSVRGSNIRIGRIAFRISKDRNYVYHIFVKMPA